MLYHDEKLLENYIKDKEANPQGSVGARFGINHQGRPQEMTPKEFDSPEQDIQNWIQQDFFHRRSDVNSLGRIFLASMHPCKY